MSGIGAIIIILQLGPLLGHAAKPEGVLANLGAVPELFTNPVHDAVILGLLALAIGYFTRPPSANSCHHHCSRCSCAPLLECCF